MNQQRQEMLSAMFDGEASEFEVRRVLSDLTHEERSLWHRYQLMHDMAQGQAAALAHFDISDKVMQAIEHETMDTVQAKIKKARLKPWVGFASAAAVAFVAVITVQQWQISEHANEHGFVADGNVSASQLPLSGQSGLSTASAVGPIVVDNNVLEKQAAVNEQKHAAEKDASPTVELLQVIP